MVVFMIIIMMMIVEVMMMEKIMMKLLEMMKMMIQFGGPIMSHSRPSKINMQK